MIRLFVLVCLSISLVAGSCGQKEPEIPSGQPLTAEQQLLRLHYLKSLGKELRLVVGRKNDEKNHPSLPAISNGEWVFNDVDETTLNTKADPIELSADFDQFTFPLSGIEDNTFSQIVIDISVWKFFSNLPTIAKQSQRILKPGGKLYFEENFGSYALLFEDFFGKTYRLLYDSDPDAPHGIAVDGPVWVKLTQEQKDAVVKQAYDEVEQRYQVFFKKYGFSSVSRHLDEPYVIQNGNFQGPLNYYEIQK